MLVIISVLAILIIGAIVGGTIAGIYANQKAPPFLLPQPDKWYRITNQIGDKRRVLSPYASNATHVYLRTQVFGGTRTGTWGEWQFKSTNRTSPDGGNSYWIRHREYLDSGVLATWRDTAVMNFTQDILGEKSYPFWWFGPESVVLGNKRKREARSLKNGNGMPGNELLLVAEGEDGAELTWSTVVRPELLWHLEVNEQL